MRNLDSEQSEMSRKLLDAESENQKLQAKIASESKKDIVVNNMQKQIEARLKEEMAKREKVLLQDKMLL